jgi:hypothetical protein
MKPITLFLISLVVATVLIQACSKSSNNSTASTMHQISATLNGASENPANTSTGTGSLTGSYDASTKTLSYNLTWTGLSGPATAAHFHGPAQAGTNAAVLVPITITNNAATGAGSGSVTIPDSVATFLSQGILYVNVHTTAKPGGEIRGQVSYQ